MKGEKKYKITPEELAEVARLNNEESWSVPALSIKTGIPPTTLRQYLHKSGFKIYFNNHRNKVAWILGRREQTEYHCNSAWKRALLEWYGNKCMIPGCNYNKILEAHHKLYKQDGGKMTRENGILLCPNHHAEVHHGLLNLALLKWEELLEKPEVANQHPSQISTGKIKGRPRKLEGSTTNSQSKESDTRASQFADCYANMI